MGQSWSHLQQRRNASALQELAPQKTPGDGRTLPKLDRSTLLTALNNTAASIAKQKHNITVIAVGGAVNTIYLQSRATTQDIDFFNNRLTPHDLGYLLKGAKEASKKSRALEDEWFNNHTIFFFFFIPKDKRGLLTEQAFDQGEVIFSAPGLTLLAAPWQYAFCCKIDRLAGGGISPARPYDTDDAVQYLHRYLLRNGVAQVPRNTIRSWFMQYSVV